MPPELIPDEEDYASEEDSDFALDDAPAEDSSVSDDEEAADGQKTAPAKRKLQAGDVEGEADDAGFENSGDEAIIQKGQKRRKKSKPKDGAAIDDDEGGDGRLIKTRSMRAVE
jgi:hypothetical protein